MRWYCSFSSVLYKHVLGDKDTFGFAFAMAGKLHQVYAVAVPPAAAFKHEVRSCGAAVRTQPAHTVQVAGTHRES